MLEKIPEGVGRALRGVRAGYAKIVSADEAFAAAPETIVLSSPAFADGETMPARYTQDGEGISPPLSWQGAPRGAAGLVLIVEDPDAPSLEPLAHLLAWDLPPDLTGLGEGVFRSARHDGPHEALGRNSFLQTAYLAPDPPTGHGRHRYVFQLFALAQRLDFTHPPGRGAVVDAMRGQVLAKGLLTGVYARQ